MSGVSPALQNSLTKSRIEKEYVFGGSLLFTTVTDHILESVCRHEEVRVCQVCRFGSELPLPTLPDMIFPNNALTLKLVGYTDENFIIQLNTFDALTEVNSKELPDIKVGPSEAWRAARKEAPAHECQQPFDWTFTSTYQGTLGARTRIEKAGPGEDVNFERLKQPDPIVFYDEICLYEDELADNGCAQMTIRVRVMPETFLVLCRFYLRVDQVMVRICDTRFYGESGWNYMIRQWTRRESDYSGLAKKDLENVFKPDLIANALPLVEKEITKIYFDRQQQG